VHLVGLYTYCRMMHGAYNVKLMKIVGAQSNIVIAGDWRQLRQPKFKVFWLILTRGREGGGEVLRFTIFRRML
jgi:hypothetical protein